MKHEGLEFIQLAEMENKKEERKKIENAYLTRIAELAALKNYVNFSKKEKAKTANNVFENYNQGIKKEKKGKYQYTNTETLFNIAADLEEIYQKCKNLKEEIIKDKKLDQTTKEKLDDKIENDLSFILNIRNVYLSPNDPELKPWLDKEKEKYPEKEAEETKNRVENYPLFKKLKNFYEKNLVPDAIDCLKEEEKNARKRKSLEKFMEEMFLYYVYLINQTPKTTNEKEKNDLDKFKAFLANVYSGIFTKQQENSKTSPKNKDIEDEDEPIFEEPPKINDVNTLLGQMYDHYLANNNLNFQEKVEMLSSFLVRNSDALGNALDTDVLSFAIRAASDEASPEKDRDVWQKVKENIELSLLPNMTEETNNDTPTFTNS